MLIMRLHNLLSRSPALSDAQAVSELLHLCDDVEATDGTVAGDDVRKRWQAADFNLSHDAWIIATSKGQIAGYADVRQNPATMADVLAFLLTVCVHQDYRERGIETLLIWLAEERVRQLSYAEPASRQVTVTTMLNKLDSHSSAIFLHEGYICVRHVWRVTIGIEEISPSSRRDQLTVDLLLDVDDLPGTIRCAPGANTYVARQHEIYEKVLPSSTIRVGEPALDMQCALD